MGKLQSLVRPEELYKLIIINYLTGSQTHDLQAFILVLPLRHRMSIRCVVGEE
jgi:hypothetical protein